MEDSGVDSFGRSYLVGLLDATARARFDISENDGEFTVRPTIRVKFDESPVRKAIIGSFLDSHDFDYRLVVREFGDDFFLVELRSDIEQLRELLAGKSAHLVRVLDFILGPFSDEFDTEVLDPVEICRFLKTRDELYHGWRPRGINYRTLEDTATKYGVDTDELETAFIPNGDCRENYSLKWFAGVYDGLCRYRPSIGRAESSDIGYAMYPTARMHRAGDNPLFVQLIHQFCDDYDLVYGDSSSASELKVVFTGAANIRRILELVLPDVYVLYEPSELLSESILPRFDKGVHRSMEGFVQLLVDFEEVARATGPFTKRRKYTPEYFFEKWEAELNFDRESPDHTESQSQSTPLDDYERQTVMPETYSDTPGRFRTIVDRERGDPVVVEELQRLYSDRCQLCGERHAKGDGTGYSEVHFLVPLGGSHGGPDVHENMLVLCPNHHADVDNGVVHIDAGSLVVTHPYDEYVDGTTLSVNEDHDLSAEFLQYHNDRFVELDVEAVSADDTLRDQV